MTTALYRRYRPDTFAEMIGQEHVTGPLMQALRSGRVNHAYLFSGPRGCGKTTSARILARTLNCHRNTPESPIDTPCGECESCTELARGGPGSLDVVEIDAASHNGVDDARDLRERATFAPVRDRYKIFILDEAHMVTPQGFNALLKIVEEPPPHIKFVFATTEPDKVIGTIRSRTHHYPFRLVPPDVLAPYLTMLCDAEGIEVGQGVLPLVTRAGGGSVRDTLSVMDQLIAGGSHQEVGYDLAVGLLGYTHASLLDDVVDALAVRDGASIFRVVDQIIATGHEPRRFVEDVLERLRDLIVIGVSGEAADAVLRELPADQLERMRAQAGRIGVAELSRAADLVNSALTEMTGATSPRLHLELLCARLLLPGADDGTAGLAARIDRLERGAVMSQATGGGASGAGRGGDDGGGGDGAAPTSVGDVGNGLTGAAAARAVVEASRAKKSGTDLPATHAERGEGPAGAAGTAERAPVGAPRSTRVPTDQASQEDAPEQGDTRRDSRTPVPDAASSNGSGGVMSTEEVRRRWPEVLETLSAARVTWSLVGQNAQVAGLEGGVLRLAFRADGLARAFSNPRHTKAVEEAIYQTLGLQVNVEGIVGDGGPGQGGDGPGGPGGGPSGTGGPDGSTGPQGNTSGHVGAAGTSPGTSGPRDTGAGAGVGAAQTGDSLADGAGTEGVGGFRASGATSAGEAPTPGGMSADSDDWPDVPTPGGSVTGAGAAVDSTPGVATSRTDGPVGSRSSAVAVAERPVRTTARVAGAALARRHQETQGQEPADERSYSPDPDEPPLPEPPPDYDVDLDPTPGAARPGAARPGTGHRDAGRREPGRPGAPIPEASYAAPQPTHLTGADRAREALRRAQESRRPAPTAPGASGAASGAANSPESASGLADVTYEELSADDPNIDVGGNGLVGVPLVVKVLEGTIIDEQVDQHM